MAFFDILRSRKMLSLLLLGFASGLPAAQADGLLPYWLKDQNIADKDVTPILALAAVPYAWKFLWSPIVDKYMPPLLGRRRGWLIITQVVLLVLIGFLAFQTPSNTNLDFFKAVVVLIGFVSATQDIASDAYRTDVLSDKAERGTGAALWTNGFRIAYLVAGSLIILLVNKLSWTGVYLLVASLMLIGIFASWWAPQPENEERPPASFADAVILPFREFFNRKGLLNGVVILLFILVYKLGDNLARVGGKLYIKHMKFSNEVIGTQGAIATISAIVGALFGAWLILKIGLNRALWIGIILLSLGILPYILLVMNGQANVPLLALAMNTEYFFGGTEAAIFVAFMMNMCDSRYSATQYALFSGIVFFGKSVVVWYTGAIKDAIGYQSFFWLCALSAIPGLLLLTYIAPWNKPELEAGQ
jgi:MFS transporter, PAT family, beta-lactamase induction signal transducer AmpG